MADSIKVITGLTRKRLTSCATLTAMVGSQAIRQAQGRPPTTCPAIRVRVVGGTGRRPKSLISGDVYINIYSTHAQAGLELASIYNVVYNRIMATAIVSLATTDGAVGAYYNEFCDYPLYDPEEGANRSYLTSRFRFSGQNRTLL